MAACISTFTCIPVSVFLYLYPCICISIPFYAPWLDAVEPVSVYSKVVEEEAGGFQRRLPVHHSSPLPHCNLPALSLCFHSKLLLLQGVAKFKCD